MSPLTKVAAAVAILGGIVGAWYLCTQPARRAESAASVHFANPLDPSSKAVVFTIDWSRWPRRRGWCYLSLANLGDPAVVSDSAAVERERSVLDAIARNDSIQDEDSRRRLDATPNELVLRVRARGHDAAGRVSNRLSGGEPIGDDWFEFSRPNWPIRASWSVGMLEPDPSAPTRVEVEILRGPSLPMGTVPAIVVDGEEDAAVLEGAEVGYALVTAAFVLTLLLVLTALLTLWSRKKRAADAAEFGSMCEAAIDARAKQARAASP